MNTTRRGYEASDVMLEAVRVDEGVLVRSVHLDPRRDIADAVSARRTKQATIFATG